MNLNSQLDSNTSIRKFNFRDLIIFIVPILIFALYLFVYNPGILTANSYSILHQIASGEYTNAHPIFYTFLVTIALKIYQSALTVGFFQILIFAVIWMLICKYHRDDTLATSNQFVLQFALTLIISLIPINAVHSITLQENVLFAYALLTLTFLIKILIDRNGQMDIKLLVILAFTLAFTSQLSSYGIFISLITLIGIIVYMFKMGNSQKTIAVLTATTLVVIILLAGLNVIYNVSDSNESYIQYNGINLEKAKSDYFSSINAQPSEPYESATSANLGSDKFNSINGFVSTFSDNPLLGTLFENPITYFVLSILALGLIFNTTQSRELLLIYIPSLLNTIIAFVAAPSQINLYANLLVFYLLAIILISLLFKSGLNLNNISLKSQIQKENPVKEAPQQTYMEPQEQYYNSFEEELEELTLDDINEMLGETTVEEYPHDGESSSDLVDEILREIEEGRK